MSISVFPIPVTVTDNAIAATVPTSGKQYKVVRELSAAIYTITCPSTVNATVSFLVGTTIVEAVTASGTVSVNLASAATELYFEINTGTNVVVTVTKTAASLTITEISGTLDTITTTSTYNQTGKLWVLCVGGGGRGAAGYGTNQYFNLGGGQGGACTDGVVYTNTAISVTIGAGAVSGGGNSGSTTFGNLISASGGANGADNTQAGTGPQVTNPATSVKTGNNGGGGAGATGTNTRTAGTGSGIGTGGAGAATTSPNAMNGGNGENGTGYGAGGGGSINSGNVVFGAAGAGNGSAGVVYVLRGW
jgi:hypothetical protein